MESISDDNVSTFDDTLPTPDEVSREFLEKAGGDFTALAWLADRGIDTAPEHAALIQYAFVWTPESGRYRFMIYGPDHVGPKRRPALAVPIIEDGVFIDLLLIGDFISFDTDEACDDRYFETACCRAPWLGRENLAGPVVRLHSHPLDWLAAGGSGVCHIEPVSRKALKDLRSVATIECNCIHTALEAWDWGFGADDDELARFMIDDSLAAIRSYFEDIAKWRTAYLARELA